MAIELPRKPVPAKRSEPKYGKAYFQKDRLTIHVDTGGHRSYPVDLKTCTNSAEMLDWILQIAGKGGCTPEMLYDLVKCIEQACFDVHGKSAQGVFCPFGKDQTVQW
jgi:hypothetical protein